METDLLAELVSCRHHLLVALRDLSRRQLAHVGAEDAAALLGVLATKQRLIEELQETDRRLDPFRAQDPEERRWRTPEDRRRCQRVAESCTALLSEILLLEQRSEADQTANLNHAAERLRAARAADEARAAYARPAAAHRGQFDVSSDR